MEMTPSPVRWMFSAPSDSEGYRKMSLISALDILMKSCKFLTWKSQHQSSK